MAAKRRIYRITFHNQGNVYEVYAKHVAQGSLFGFVEIQGLLFGEKTTMVVDPTEEALRREFSGVERTYIPLHAVVRIDEVEKRGASKIRSISETGAKVTPLPTTIYAPVKRDS